MNCHLMLNPKFSCRTCSINGLNVQHLQTLKRTEVANLFLSYWRVSAAFLEDRLLVILTPSVKLTPTVTVAQWKESRLAPGGCLSALLLYTLDRVWTRPAHEPGPCCQVNHQLTVWLPWFKNGTNESRVRRSVPCAPAGFALFHVHRLHPCSVNVR